MTKSLLAAVLLLAAAVRYSYDAAGRLTGVDYGDGRTIVYTYDKAGNLLSRTVSSSSSSSSSSSAAASRKPRPAAPVMPSPR